MGDLLSPHFSVLELACRCGCGLVPDRGFVEALERLRVEVGFAMPVSSGMRCPARNVRVASTGPNGPHTVGAVDVVVSGGRAVELVGAAIRQGWTGYGLRQHGPHVGRFVHLDRLVPGGPHPRPWVWTY